MTVPRFSQRWWRWIGAPLGAVLLAWVLLKWHSDLDRFLAVFAHVDARYLALVPLAIMVEQLVRAWKWRQLLYPIRPIGTLRLFGAIMAGYLAGFVVPFGFSELTRCWIVARREGLTTGSVLATAALDRLTDGIVFALLIPVALILVRFPDPTGDIRAALAWAAAGSLVMFTLLSLALALVAYKRGILLRPDGGLLRVLERLPGRLGAPVRRFARVFADGIVWPRAWWRGLGIVLASIGMKLIVATPFLWAGLALDAAPLQPTQYLFVMIFTGFVVYLGHVLRLFGSFVMGAVFVLGLFGVAKEQALAMALVVEGATLLSVAGIGALAFWREGVAFAELRAAGAVDASRSD